MQSTASFFSLPPDPTEVQQSFDHQLLFDSPPPRIFPPFLLSPADLFPSPLSSYMDARASILARFGHALPPSVTEDV
jgi:hypothetical protein